MALVPTGIIRSIRLKILGRIIFGTQFDESGHESVEDAMRFGIDSNDDLISSKSLLIAFNNLCRYLNVELPQSAIIQNYLFLAFVINILLARYFDNQKLMPIGRIALMHYAKFIRNVNYSEIQPLWVRNILDRAANAIRKKGHTFITENSIDIHLIQTLENDNTLILRETLEKLLIDLLDTIKKLGSEFYPNNYSSIDKISNQLLHIYTLNPIEP